MRDEGEMEGYLAKISQHSQGEDGEGSCRQATKCKGEVGGEERRER